MAWEREVIGACTLYRGDAREVLPLLTPVDAVVTDPPYGVEFKGKRAHSGRGFRAVTTVRPGQYSHEDTAEYIQAVILPVLAACHRLASSMVVMPGIRTLWLYPPAEDLGCFFMPGGTGMGRWGFTCMQPILYYGKDPYLAAGLGSRPNAVLSRHHNDANAVDHPCAKPLAMMQWLVHRASLSGQTVLDPFMGSGTTGVACLALGRAFVGIDIDAGYFDVACHRIEEASRQVDLFRAVSGFSQPRQETLAL